MRQISDRESEESYEISVRTHKDLPVTIVVIAHIWGDFKRNSDVVGSPMLCTPWQSMQVGTSGLPVVSAAPCTLS